MQAVGRFAMVSKSFRSVQVTRMVRLSQAFGGLSILRLLTTGPALLLVITCAALVAGCQPSAKGPTVETEGEVAGTEKVSNGPSRSATLKAVKARGKLRCGVSTGQIGFAFPDNRGRWTGFDVDFCRATAAAIFGDPDRVTYVPLASKDRITALKAGRVDVLWRNTSYSFSRDVADGVDFAGVNYYDGQGFLVRRTLNLTSATELGGARICMLTGSTSALNVQDFFAANALNYDAVPVQTEAQAREAYAAEKCDALTSDIAELAAVRSTLEGPQGHVILPDVIAKEPVGPVVRHGDPAWADLVRWTLNALILAEELNITRETLDDVARTSTSPEVRRLLGLEGQFGKSLGLSERWAYNAIKAGGNYGEIFERNLGSKSALNLDRGINALWLSPRPGLIYAPPFR